MKTEDQIIEELRELEADLIRRIKRIGSAVLILQEELGVLSLPREVNIKINPGITLPAEKSTEEETPKHGIISAKKCVDCEKMYHPTSNVQKRCEDCRSKKVNIKINAPD